MIDFTKPVQTRDGKPVRVLCTDKAGGHCIVGIVQHDTCDTVRTWTKDGLYWKASVSKYDLVQAPVKRSVWLNMYPDRVISYKDKVNADMHAMQDRVACIEVHYTEGEGLEDV